MKKYILLLWFLSMCPLCFSQINKEKDSIQLYYNTGWSGVASIRQDHCITIVFDGDSMVLTRKCYVTNYTPKCTQIAKLQFETILTFGFNFERYDKFEKENILCNYMENNHYIILDERVHINETQLADFIKIINEIKMFASNTSVVDACQLRRAYNQYVLINKREISFIFDYKGDCDRSIDIENALGLRRYSPCPCRQESKIKK